MLYKTIIFIFLSVSLLQANDSELQKIFEKFNLKGTLVIASLSNKENYLFDAQRAKTRFIVASTFKIPHTLIALSEKLIHNEDDIIKWDAKQREYEEWNKDQTLKSAMQVSCVWCYQRFSYSLSKEKYLEYLKKFDYGNQSITTEKSKFWLGDGSLKISAFEQIAFLKKFYSSNLPIEKKFIDITKKIIVVEEKSDYTLYAKSGWSGTIGWYVGYVKTKKDVYFFAMNAEINATQLALRKELVMAALNAKKIIGHPKKL